MNIHKFISSNFEYVWGEYCNNQMVGYKILGKDAFSSSVDFPIMWGYSEEFSIKVLIILCPQKGRFIPLTFIDVAPENRKLYSRRRFPTRLSHRYKNIGDFQFEKRELHELSNGKTMEFILKKKSGCIDKKSFEKIFLSLLRSKPGGGEKTEPKSVYTISGGLYGLGKNRKH